MIIIPYANLKPEGGEAGIDYDGQCYIADGTVDNASGISGADFMGGNRRMSFWF